jgi:hypothetical protein
MLDARLAVFLFGKNRDDVLVLRDHQERTVRRVGMDAVDVNNLIPAISSVCSLIVSYWPIAAVSPRSGRYGRYRRYCGRAPLPLSADGKPLTFDFTEVIPLPLFSLRLGFHYAGIDRNVHNAWAYSSRAASCIRKLWNKIPRQPSNLAFQFSADLIFVFGPGNRQRTNTQANSIA